MAKVPLSERPAISQWLIRARGETTQEALLNELRAETGWAPDLSTYRGWESGRLTPRDSNLSKVVAFWERRGIRQEVAAAPLSLEERAVIAAERQADAMSAADLATALAALASATSEMARELAALREERSALASRVEDLEGQVDQLVLAGRVGRGSGAPQVLDAPGQ